MSELTRILSRIETGDGKAAQQLLPLVYDELRKLVRHGGGQERADDADSELAAPDGDERLRIRRRPRWRSSGSSSEARELILQPSDQD